MNLRCIYCQTPFTLARGEMLSAIVQMNEKNQNHYDAHCPRCRRANSISRQRMELFYPNWQEAAKHQPAVAASSSSPSMSASGSTPQKTEPLPKGVKTTAKKSTPKPDAKAVKASTGKKPAARKRPTAKKTASKAKPAAKKSPAKGKKKK